MSAKSARSSLIFEFISVIETSGNSTRGVSGQILRIGQSGFRSGLRHGSESGWKEEFEAVTAAGFRPEYLLTACDYRLSNRGSRNSYRERVNSKPADSTPAGFSCETLAPTESRGRGFRLRENPAAGRVQQYELLQISYGGFPKWVGVKKGGQSTAFFVFRNITSESDPLSVVVSVVSTIATVAAITVSSSGAYHRACD